MTRQVSVIILKLYFLCLLQNASNNPVGVDVTVDVDGNRVIKASYPKSNGGKGFH